MDEQGLEEFQTYRLNELDRFKTALQPSDEIAVEATGNTRFFVDQVSPLVQRVVVVDPGRFEMIKKSVKKTDKNDARALAQFLSKGLLPEARTKTRPQAQMSSLVQTRDNTKSWQIET
jgi:transposase